jgi:hypothetical protein
MLCVFYQDQLVLPALLFLSVSLEGMGCEPVLNLAATPDEAVSIMCTFVDKTIPSTFGELMYVFNITDQPGASVGHSADALALIIIFGFFDMIDLRLWDALPRCCHSWRDLLIQYVCQYQFVGLDYSTHVCS